MLGMYEYLEDIEKAGRGTLGENQNENVTMDPWSYLEGQEKK